jgi:hypothetical protein
MHIFSESTAAARIHKLVLLLFTPSPRHPRSSLLLLPVSPPPVLEMQKFGSIRFSDDFRERVLERQRSVRERVRVVRFG